MAQLIEIEPDGGFHVVAKTRRSEAATMVIDPGESVGGSDNKHHGKDQWMYVVSGEGQAQVEDKSYKLSVGSLLLIESNETHRIKNTSAGEKLKTLNIYAPPEY